MTSLGFVDIYPGVITNDYGKKNSSYALGYHTGIDIKLTDPYIKAYCPGTVYSVGTTGSYGNHVWVKAEDGTYHLYAHMKSIYSWVKEGASVSSGKLLGVMGSTGNSTGPHLHYEIRTDINEQSSNIDPETYYGKSFDFNKITTDGDVPQTAIESITGQDSGSWATQLLEWMKGGSIKIILVIFAFLLIFAALKVGFLGGQ